MERSKGILEAEENSAQLEDALIELYANGDLAERLEVSEAQMNVYAEASLPDFSNFDISKPVYIPLTTMPQLGIDYRIKISSTGYETVEAVSRIPDPVLINRTYVSDTVFTTIDVFEGETYTEVELELSIEFDDQANAENYYYLRLIEQRDIHYYLEDDAGQIVLDDMGNPIIERTGVASYPIGFRTNDLSLEEVEDAFDDLDPESTGESYFYSAALFSDDLFNGQTKTLKVIPFTNALFNDPEDFNKNKIFVEFGTMSRDLYAYIQSTDLQQYTDGDPFAEPVRVHNNVSNGFGIFGGFSFIKTEVE